MGTYPILDQGFSYDGTAQPPLAARIIPATMTEVCREDPLISAIVTAGVASAEQVDELFRVAAEM
jgi:hypothetical protein